MKEVILFVIAIIKKGDKYLLTKRQEIDKKDPKDFLGKWQLPGGGVNFGERVEEAVKREVKEELALDVEVISLVPYVIQSIRKNWHGIGIVLFCRLTDVKQGIELNQEADEYGWFTFSEIMKLDVLPGGKEAIKIAETLDER